MEDRYKTYFDIDDENNSHSIALRMIGKGKKVLEVGCASGFASKTLKKMGCYVVGIDIMKEYVEKSSKYCDETYLFDIQDDIKNLFKTKSFDVIYFGDVIEHLTNFEALFKNIEYLLRLDGYIVASIPNVAHGSVRLALMNGKFDYTDIGLLDRTHVSLFTRKNIILLFSKYGYYIDKFENTYLDYDEVPEIPINLSEYPKQITKYVEADPESYVYQYVFVATRDTEAGYLNKLENDLEDSLNKNVKKDKVIEKLNNEKKDLEDLSNSYKLKLEKNEKEFQNWYNLVEDLKGKISNLDKEVEKLNGIIIYERNKSKKYSEDLTELNSNKAAIENELNELKEANKNLISENNELKEANKNLISENNKYRGSIFYKFKMKFIKEKDKNGEY